MVFEKKKIIPIQTFPMGDNDAFEFIYFIFRKEMF